jgi:hypothetical protein
MRRFELSNPETRFLSAFESSNPEIRFLSGFESSNPETRGLAPLGAWKLSILAEERPEIERARE